MNGKGQSMAGKFLLKDKNSNQWVAKSGKNVNDIFYYFTERREDALHFSTKSSAEQEMKLMKSLGFKTDVFDIVEESATYQKKRFKEPAYMYESVSSSKIKSSDDLYEWMTEYMRKHGSNRFTSLQFILGNGNNIIIAWDMKSYKGIHEGSKDYTMTEFVYKFMEPIIQNSGISSIYEADMDTGRFKPVKEEVIVIHHPWGEEIKDYKAGDPIPAGTKFKIFKTRDQKAIDAWIDSLYESTKKLNESYYVKWGKKYFCNLGGSPAWGPIKDLAIKFASEKDARDYMKNIDYLLNDDADIKIVKESKKVVENKTVGIISLPVGSKFIDDSFGGKRTMEVVKHGDDDVVHVKEVGTGRKFAYDASTPGGNKKVEKIEESFIIMDTINGKPTYFHYGKFTGYDWWYEKDKATKFSTKEKAEQMIEKMRQEGALIKDMKVIEEGCINESVIKAYYRGNEHRLNKEGYVADKDGKKLAPWKTQAYNFGSEADAAKAIKVIEKKPEWKDFTLVVEGRIARGYENLDANEKAKHLLSHPCSKYMSDLKTGNITERAIRKAVKEMLGKPDKDDQEFVDVVNEELVRVNFFTKKGPLLIYKDGFSSTNAKDFTSWTDAEKEKDAIFAKYGKKHPDIYANISLFDSPTSTMKRGKQYGLNEEGCIKESAYYIKSPHGFYVMKTDNSYDLTDDKEKALKYTIGNDAAKELAYIHRYSPDSRLKKLMVVQEEGEAPAAAPATSTANVANPELPLKLKESLSSKTHKFKPEELKVGKKVIDKVGGKEVHGKITVNHHDLYKDNPYTQDKKGSTVVTIVTDSGRSYDVDANDNGGEFILEGCKGKKKISEGYTVIFPTGTSEKLKTIADVNKFVNGVLKMMGKKASNVQLTDATLDKWNKENDIPLVIVKEDDETLENHFKYQTSVAGGMSSDAENAESAKEYEEKTTLVESIIKKSVRKKLTESVGQKLNITLIRKPQNMKEVESDMRAGRGDRVKAIVDKSYKLSANEYDKFVYNFMVHTTYLSGEGGVDSDGTVHVVEITAPGKKTIYVDPEGYDYARYVGW